MIKVAAFDVLKTLVEELGKIVDWDITSAEGLPIQRVNIIGSLNIETRVYGNKPDSHTAKAIAHMRIDAEEREREIGEREAAVKLHQIAMRIEAIRAVLPGLAAEASIQLGALARETEEKARAFAP